MTVNFHGDLDFIKFLIHEVYMHGIYGIIFAKWPGFQILGYQLVLQRVYTWRYTIFQI